MIADMSVHSGKRNGNLHKVLISLFPFVPVHSSERILTREFGTSFDKSHGFAFKVGEKFRRKLRAQAFERRGGD